MGNVVQCWFKTAGLFVKKGGQDTGFSPYITFPSVLRHCSLVTEGNLARDKLCQIFPDDIFEKLVGRKTEKSD